MAAHAARGRSIAHALSATEERGDGGGRTGVGEPNLVVHDESLVHTLDLRQRP
jgi:hypothetical protein